MARLVSWLVAFVLLLAVGAVSTPSKHHRDVAAAVRLTRRQAARRCPNSNRRPAIPALDTTSSTSIAHTSSTRPASSVIHAQSTASSTRLVTTTRQATASGRPGRPVFMPGLHRGDGTYYDAGLGACGITNNKTDFIVAVSTTLFDTFPGAGANPNLNPICNRGIRAWRAGRTDAAVDVTVTDRCGGCKPFDLDFSDAAFLRLGAFEEGRIKIEWKWADEL